MQERESTAKEKQHETARVSMLLILTNQHLLQVAIADTQSLQHVVIWEQLKGKQTVCSIIQHSVEKAGEQKNFWTNNLEGKNCVYLAST